MKRRTDVGMSCMKRTGLGMSGMKRRTGLGMSGMKRRTALGMSGRMFPCVTGLLYILSCPVITGTVYIQTGSDIADCNMKCPHSEGVLELYTRCGWVERPLLELHCDNLYTKNNYKTRLHLDTQSGCWRLSQAGKTDSCVYITEFHSSPTRQLSSTDIRVLDPVLLSNITSNCSRLGQNVAVSVQFSGEESAVTWEMDGEPLPERYRLIDDNRTLIIPSVKSHDAHMTFRVRITNPVSEEIREYRLENDTMFITMPETQDSGSYGRTRWGVTGVPVILGAVIGCILYKMYSRRGEKSNDTLNNAEEGRVTRTSSDSGDMMEKNGMI